MDIFTGVEFGVFALFLINVFIMRKEKYFHILLLLSFIFAFLFENTAIVMSAGTIGGYHYSERFHLFLWHTPVFILLSWSMIITSTYFYLKNTSIAERLIPVFTGLIALMFDLSMDIFAIRFKFWFWNGYSLSDGFFGVPGNNYLGWFLVSWIFPIFYQRLRLKILSPLFAFIVYFFLMSFMIIPIQNIFYIQYMEQLVFDGIFIISIVLLHILIFREKWRTPVFSIGLFPFLINRISFLAFSIYSLFYFYKPVFLVILLLLIFIETVIYSILHFHFI